MMVVSETRQFDDTIKKYEKDAMERVLDFFSQTSGRVDWFENCDVLITHLRENLSMRPFCDFLRMYLYETCQLKEQYPSCGAVPDSRYYREFTGRFAANGMENIASIDPEKPHALDHRFVYRLFRKEHIGRDVAFLLAFGLGMDDDSAGKLITRIIRESGYNFKDPREAIYFYCLRNHLGYPGVVRFLEIYRQLAPMESRFTRESHTYEYEQCFRSVRNEEEFIELLADVKAAERSFGRSRRDVFIDLLDMYKKQIFFTSEDYIDTLLSNSSMSVINSAVDISLYQVEKSIYYPDTRNGNSNMLPNYRSSLSGKSWFLKTKLTRQKLAGILNGTAEISRSDIVTMVFLNDNLWDSDTSDPRQQLKDFIAVADDFLISARFAPFCIENPYESFIALCLCSECPQDSYRMVWSESFREGGDVQ